ncbi:50S ribosomal subunit protein L4 [Candidatus Hodgkinia cicadicola]|uniref:Large ribosomal subunit protein uL4 n=1 Tax=Candidatus Hodgkinia cicadicola TaxID=573658 RepID=A0ABX4MJY2_9HYPH|nr:50S ribosomal subunit protein L4 [Candidatus Hodgkinia cicadicola]PIM95844.1 50S ribosomal subunit protein L4 [Candidatus Hodgkinia cicadicola]PIM95965.1 50S ribosomal subunit protein L4 [Candidatus Hodgkinia cicadicola]PIM96154.1 50S ribosomal subunit protein L4 [Candidatus Hodgkinia cicadicola]PIM96193.1 50S ribosomal subunit protein L4 [Candidatus Hodgkinia cicadicola]
MDKRRWYVSYIKIRSDSEYSNKKLYKQKGMGVARHSTKSVSQFKGGYKYSAIKKIKRSKTNKRYRDIAIRSVLVEKVKDGKLLLINRLTNVRNLVVSGLLIHTSDEDKQIIYATKIGFCCIHWSKLDISSLIKTKQLLFTDLAMNKLCNTLESRWQLITN